MCSYTILNNCTHPNRKNVIINTSFKRNSDSLLLVYLSLLVYDIILCEFVYNYLYDNDDVNVQM